MTQIPSPETHYKSPPGMELSREVWDGVLRSISERLGLIEGKAITYDDTVDRLTNQALALIGANITAEVEARRDDLTALTHLADDLEARIMTLLVGIGAEDVRIRTVIEGLAARTVQAALIEVTGKITTLATAFAKQRRITVSGVYLGGS